MPIHSNRPDTVPPPSLLLTRHHTAPCNDAVTALHSIGLTPAETEASVVAFNKTMLRMFDKLVGMGGFAWQLADEHWHVVRKTSPDVCAATLREWCVPKPPQWERAHFYRVSTDQVTANATDFTAEFLLTRGPYAWLGFGWSGCFTEPRSRPELWDLDYGLPQGACQETGKGTGVFQRNYSRAAVKWDCPNGRGEITLFDDNLDQGRVPVLH